MKYVLPNCIARLYDLLYRILRQLFKHVCHDSRTCRWKRCVVSQLFQATTAVAILGDLPSTEPRPWTRYLHHHRQYLGL